MTRSGLVTGLLLAAIVGTCGVGQTQAQDGTDLSGRWALNRDLSQFPREIGFGVDWASPRGRDPDAIPTGPGALRGMPESEDDARRKLQLTSEVRTPPARLDISDTATAVTMSDDRGRSRTFRPTGRDETLQLDDVTVVANAKREGGRLVVLYKVQQGRELRYTFSRVLDPPRLVVTVEFLERGGGDRVTHVYEPARAGDAQPSSSADRAPAGSRPAAQAGSREPPPVAPQPPETFDQRPDAALRGLTTFGVVVEDLGSQAVACGVNRDALETMVSDRLSAAGFRVRRNTADDPYVYVNVMTASVSGGACVSRYDVSFLANATARLPYQDRPVLVDVVLLRRGGLAGSAAAGHGAAVLRGVQEYVDAFVARIRDANR